MSDPLKRALGATVQAARRRARLTQEELAHRIGRTPESVSNIERAQQLPTLETLFDLGRALDVPLTAFFESLEEARPLAPERVQLEARLRESVRRLSDRDLAIAAEQIEAFLKPH